MSYFDPYNDQANGDPPSWGDTSQINSSKSSPDAEIVDTNPPAAASTLLANPVSGENQLNDVWNDLASGLPNLDEHVHFDFGDYQSANHFDFFAKPLDTAGSNTDFTNPVPLITVDSYDAPSAGPVATGQLDHASGALSNLQTYQEPQRLTREASKPGHPMFTESSQGQRALIPPPSTLQASNVSTRHYTGGVRPILPSPQTSSPNVRPIPAGSATPVSSNSSPALPTIQGFTQKKPSTAKAKQKAVKVTIHKNELLVSSLLEAKHATTKLIKLTVDKDDRSAVAAHPENWVPRIARAFDHAFKALPEDEDKYTTDGKDEWTRWQSEHENKVWAIFSASDDPSKLAQASAFMFYQVVLDAHQDGSGLHDVASTISSAGPNLKLKCSERIEAAIKVLEDYSIVRYDFLRQERLEGLAASPAGFAHRKIENMLVNYGKKEPTKPAKIDSKVKVEFAIRSKKRKAVETAAADGDEEDASAGPVPRKVKPS